MATPAYVTKGPLAGKIIPMSAEDFEQAVADGWAVKLTDAVKGARPGPHKAAEAYQTRMLKGEPPQKKPVVEDVDPVEPDTDAAPKKTGRPKKA